MSLAAGKIGNGVCAVAQDGCDCHQQIKSASAQLERPTPDG